MFFITAQSLRTVGMNSQEMEIWKITGGMIVVNRIWRYIFIGGALFLFFPIALGCDSKKESATMAGKPVIAPGPGMNEPPVAKSTTAQTASPHTANARTESAEGIAVDVDGEKMTRSQLDQDIQKRMSALKGQVPAEQLENARTEIRRTAIDEFIISTLLNKEVSRNKLTATDKEIAEVMDAMKGQLPAGMTLEEVFKNNKIDASAMREEIGLNIRINKLVAAEVGDKARITDKEVADFYQKNQDQFKQPESVHARHILVAKTPGDTDKVTAGKKTKAEELQKRLVAGADFADLAAKNSDCPSKKNGGDLGFFARGQMVKPFEDAAFSQQKNAIGPIVETDFGFHIIQILEHRSAQIAKLDAETKKQIRTFLEQQKKQTAYDRLVKRLKAGANIVIFGT
jgi:peptidyl-prolyl cis-trans isomerase C